MYMRPKFVGEWEEIYGFFKLAKKAINNDKLKKEVYQENVEELRSRKPSRKDMHSQPLMATMIEEMAKSFSFSNTMINRQMVVTYFSLMENEMIRIVKLVLESNPDLVMEIGKSYKIRAKEMLGNANQKQLFIEKEIQRFNFMPVRKKLNYLAKCLKIGVPLDLDENIDVFGINELRDRIVHSEETIDVPDPQIENIAWYVLRFGCLLFTKATERYELW